MLYILQVTRAFSLIFSILAIPGWIIGVGIPISLGWFAFFWFTAPAIRTSKGYEFTTKDLKKFRIGAVSGFLATVLAIMLFRSLSALDGSSTYDNTWLLWLMPAFCIAGLLMAIDHRLASSIVKSRP